MLNISFNYNISFILLSNRLLSIYYIYTSLKFKLLESYYSKMSELDKLSQQLSDFGVDNPIVIATELLKRCKGVDNAINYYFENPDIFSNLKINQDELMKESSSSSSSIEDIASISLDNSFSAQLMNLGLSSDQIDFAKSRFSSIEGYFEYISSQELKEATFQCCVCIENYVASQMITLSCVPEAHRLCKDCFIAYCTHKINENQVDPSSLICPIPKCNTSITPQELIGNLDTKILEKYERFTMRQYCESEKLASCPKCNEFYIDIASNEDAIWNCVTCGLCSHKFCGKCLSVPHKGQKDINITCEEYSKWLLENSKVDESFNEYVKANKVFPCPKCKRMAVLKEGCKFLTCIAPCKCHFCALCGIQLIEKQHHAHFHNEPHGDKCKGVTDTEGVVG